MGADQQRPKQSGPAVPAAVEDFIARWLGREGGQERANYSMFLTELCSALAIQPPDPAGDPETNDYVFERIVKEPGRDGGVSSRRVDLYKRDCFVLEAKQSLQNEGGEKEVHGQKDLFGGETQTRGRRGAERAWDVLMINARRHRRRTTFGCFREATSRLPSSSSATSAIVSSFTPTSAATGKPMISSRTGGPSGSTSTTCGERKPGNSSQRSGATRFRWTRRASLRR